MRLECWCQDSAVSVVMSCQRYEAGHSISHVTHPPFQIRARDQRAREVLPSSRFLGRAPQGRQCQRRGIKARAKAVSSVAGWASAVIRPLDVISWTGVHSGTAIRLSEAGAVNFFGPRDPLPPQTLKSPVTRWYKYTPKHWIIFIIGIKEYSYLWSFWAQTSK